jgi:hypothetical protein
VNILGVSLLPAVEPSLAPDLRLGYLGLSRAPDQGCMLCSAMHWEHHCCITRERWCAATGCNEGSPGAGVLLGRVSTLCDAPMWGRCPRKREQRCAALWVWGAAPTMAASEGLGGFQPS